MPAPRSLFAAARLARANGMQLLATDCDPDWAMNDGNYDEGPSDRAIKSKDQPHQLAAITPTESHRVAASRAAPYCRYHYRYLAADLAWQASQLLPDQSDELARLLVEAGTWLKFHDPQAADRFYKALVTRCGNTSLGFSADALHWFPPLADSLATQPR